MDTDSEYYQQLQVINQMLEQTPEGPERDELNSLRQNIEELLLLTEQSTSTLHPEEKSSSNTQDNEKSDSNSAMEDAFAEEYALFMAEMTQEGAIESQDAKEDKPLEGYTNSDSLEKLKELEGKKFRAPHTHQWGQIAYHNAMVCSVPQIIPDNELQVKVLFLNPTHKEMLPCPYYFDLEKDCHFSEDQCRFSHGQLVPFSSLQDYIEPKFENLTIGSEVLAKQSDDLWYRGKIAHISKEKCLVKFESKNIQNQNFEEIVFEHILPLDQSENNSDDSGSDSDVKVIEISDDEEGKRESKKRHEELINNSLMLTPDTVPLGEWEKYTKGIGSKLMQKMGYIVGTGLGKEGRGIIKPVTALILPQGKSLDFCMNLKEKAKDPHLFNAEKKAPTLMKKKEKKPSRKKVKLHIQLEQMDLEKYIIFYFGRGMFAIDEKESRLLREKLKVATTKDINVANFIIEKRIKMMIETEDDLKTSIQRIEEKQAEPKGLYKKLVNTKTTLKRMNIFRLLVQNELDRRKNDKEMSVF